MTQNTLVVSVESLAAVRDRADEAIERAVAGDVPAEDAPRRISFETTDQLYQVFSPRAIELLQAVVREEPASMREAARVVDRDIRQVSENLNRLAEYGVVEFVENGRAKRPVVPYDEIDIRLPLRAASDTDAGALSP